MNNTLLALTACAMLLTLGCSQAPAPVADTRDADIKAIKDTDATMAKDMEAKNYDKFPTYYADEAIMMTNGAPATKKAGIADLSKMLVNMQATLKFASEKVDVAKSGDLGYAQGAYTIAYTDPKTKRKMMEKGNYVTVYKKQADGSWKIVADINTPDSENTVVKSKTAEAPRRRKSGSKAK